MQDIWDFLSNNKDAIASGATILGILGGVSVALWGAWKLLIERWWKGRLRGEVKVFEVITDSNSLLPKIFATENDDSPLADHRIVYQPRDPKRDIQADLKTELKRSRYLLITAPTGFGKTREAGVLAQSMMLEGWRVLRIKSGWLDLPKTLPEGLGGNRSRVLIFLDDLNGLFSTGELTQSPRAEQMPLLSQLSYHDRLLQVLDMLEGMCTKKEVCVLATARSEADQWKLLDFDKKDGLWKRFERIELPEPDVSAIVGLLEDAIKKADLRADPQDFEDIAHKNDGTYRNILLNLRRWRALNKAVDKDDLTETLDGSWRDIYESAVKKQPAVKYIYDAIDILQQAGIELLPFLVEPVVLLVWGGSSFQKFIRRRRIWRALHYLTQETNILRHTESKFTPSDGQIEAKKRSLSWVSYYKQLTQLLLNNSDRTISNSLYGLATACYYQSQFEQSHLLIVRYVKLNPLDSDGHNVLGILLSNLKRYDEAEAAYRKAIDLNPSYATAYYNLGNLLSDENLKRYDEAEAAYRKAIDLNPSYATAYSNLGLLLHENLKRYDEAEAAYRKAIELNPSYATAYYNLGILLKDLKRYDEAEAAYRKAIELNPSYATAYYNLSCLSSINRDAEQAFGYLQKAIDNGFDPAYAWDDPDLQWLRDDPRFVEIVGEKPAE
jgi:Flp pilus assembly protein TadD